MAVSVDHLLSSFKRHLSAAADGRALFEAATELLGEELGAVCVLALSFRHADAPRAIDFRLSLAGAQPAELLFFSPEASPALRPRLRITSLPRPETAIPCCHSGLCGVAPLVPCTRPWVSWPPRFSAPRH